MGKFQKGSSNRDRHSRLAEQNKQQRPSQLHQPGLIKIQHEKAGKSHEIKLENDGHQDANPSNSKTKPIHHASSSPTLHKSQARLHHRDGNKAHPNSQAEKVKRNRLIIRNLVFDINQKHIEKLFQKYGKLKQINIPKHPDRQGTRGYAFVEMQNKNCCLKAIKELNGVLFKGRKIVLDLSVSKQKYMTEQLNSKKSTNQQKMEEENKGSEIKQQQSGNVKIQDEDSSQMEEQEEQIEPQLSDIEEEEQEDNEEELNRQIEDHKTEIFIRNLSTTTTEEDLYNKFKKYGKIKFVKLVMNKDTNLSKGTAFIKFDNSETASKLIEYSRSYEMYLLKKLRNFVADPAISLEMDGMIMKIFSVENRSQIESKLKSRQQAKNADTKKKPIKKIKRIEDLIKTDPHGKRNLELALLGSWRADENMNKFDYEKFKSHEKQKIEKLKNPNNSVSSTRIVLKNLDKSISEEKIKSLCLNFLTERRLSNRDLVYCKLMLDSSREKSAGFAFVEFKKHEQAKQFIESLLKNSKILMNKHFIVEFAIQDSRKLMKLNKSKNSKQIQKAPHPPQALQKKIKKPRHEGKRNSRKKLRQAKAKMSKNSE